MIIKEYLTKLSQAAFTKCGFSSDFGAVTKCKLAEFGDFSISGALAAAKNYGKNPQEIAKEIKHVLAKSNIFSKIEIAGPGYINLTLDPGFIVTALQGLLEDHKLGCQTVVSTIVLDFGGANVAKPLHVGHLRSAIIGEALKRIAIFNGAKVIGDIHLGDWGLQMGMLIHELQLRYPNWAYFDESLNEFPLDSPITIHDLEELYPTASAKAKGDAKYLAACRQATFELQAGRAGYLALWRHIVDISIADLKQDYNDLNVSFDLWLGESDANKYLPELIKRLNEAGFTEESEGALIIEVKEPDDNQPMPPVILQKSDGAILYHATDIATIAQRVEDFTPDAIIYVVDKRQSLHFQQVFRAVQKTGIAPAKLRLEHIPFGTMNGTDGKPFKTRSGGVLKLKDLISMVTNKALQRLKQGGYAEDLKDETRQYVAKCVGLAALKFGDLSNICARDYIFDLDKFLNFEGKTGPYLLYSAVRAKSILRKARLENAEAKLVAAPQAQAERDLMLVLLDFPEACSAAFKQHEPKLLCEYGYLLATSFSSFYAKVPILAEPNNERKEVLLALVAAFLRIITTVLDLLGINVPEKM